MISILTSALDRLTCCFWKRNCRFRFDKSIVSRSICRNNELVSVVIFVVAVVEAHNINVLKARHD